MTAPATTDTARTPEDLAATRIVSTADGNEHTIPTDPPTATLIGCYTDGCEQREVLVEPGGDGAWRVIDRRAVGNRESVEVEAIPYFVEDPLSEAVALAADYRQVVAQDPDRRIR